MKEDLLARIDERALVECVSTFQNNVQVAIKEGIFGDAQPLGGTCLALNDRNRGCILI